MNHKAISPATLFLFYILSIGSVSVAPTTPKGTHHLRLGFYEPTCPQAEEIIFDSVSSSFMYDPTIAAGLIRLYFHDCFVRGCDASILLDATPTSEPVEKESPANGKTLRGLEVIDNAKSRLEAECPGTVSCADILAFAARDAAALAGLRRYTVPSGRRDGFISRASDIPGNLPPPIDSIDTLTEIFAKKGFSLKEMVILSGAHSIGGAHCSSFSHRLYNFTGKQLQDPSMDPFYAGYLKLECPILNFLPAEFTIKRTVDFDSISGLVLDNSYYVGLQRGRGLLSSDQVLMKDSRTRRLVRYMASHPDIWADMFGTAMVKLGGVEVLVGNEGEVRRSCRFVN